MTKKEEDQLVCRCPTNERDGNDLQKEYRKVAEIHFPEFKSPVELRKFLRGGQECSCVCHSKYIPRNVVLIRPKDKMLGTEIYDLLVNEWQRGVFRKIAQGSCQHFIRTAYLRKELKPILDLVSISCVDNADPSLLQEGDVLLTRIGREKSIGKPYLILESKEEK